MLCKLLFLYLFSLNLVSLPKAAPDDGKCKCGKQLELDQSARTRIFGGTEPPRNIYPWMALITYFGQIHCGGSLINDRYVLTAGHCVHRFSLAGLMVTLGLHELGVRIPGQTAVMALERTIVHHEFHTKDLYDINDIALMKLKTPVEFTKFVNPICLPVSDEPDQYDFVTGNVAGWGSTSKSLSQSNFMLHASVKVMSFVQCNSTALSPHLLPNMLCAIYPGVDACQGDSGGPLMYLAPTTIETTSTLTPEDTSVPAKYVQIGVVSWGFGCASDEPGVYTRVSSHTAWIHEKTADANYCLDFNNVAHNKTDPGADVCVYK